MSVRARILANINKGEQPNDCWPWTGYLHKSGRPYMSVKGKMKAVSRIVYEEFIGAIPDGECVCHCCDNPKCLNPAHLFTATQAVNIADMKSKAFPATSPRALEKLLYCTSPCVVPPLS